MKDYVKEAWKALEQAFEPPIYFGDLSKPQIKSKPVREFLATSNKILSEGQESYGDDALSNYSLGILYKYLNKEGGEYDFIGQMKKALNCDPNFLEAIIALRDGENYMDPFYYPKWEDLCDGKADFRTSILNTQTKTNKIDIVRYNWSLIPAIVVKYPRTSFRTTLTDNIEIKVLVNIEAVPPNMPALMHIVTVIFDDHKDPFFCNSYLNLFPIETVVQGIPFHQPPDYQPWLGRDTARRFCQEPCRCALFVLDMENRIMIARLIDFNTSETENFKEMDKILQILGDKKIDYMGWKGSTEIHNECYVRELLNPKGELVRIPRGKDPKLSEKFICPIVCNGDRLMIKGIEEGAKIIHYHRRNDIFIIYAHADMNWVCKIKDCLKNIWPSIIIYQSSPKVTDKIKKGEFFFLLELRRSHCVVFLATPRSFKSPFVGSELGAAVDKLVISILAGGATISDLKDMRDNDLFNWIDLNKVANIESKDGWDYFVRLLANGLKISLPDIIPDGPILDHTAIIESNIKNPFPDFLKEYTDSIIRLLK